MTVDNDDHLLARTVAAEAGRRLLQLRHELEGEGVSADRLRSEGDRVAHELIVEHLRAARPDDALLSEEGIDDDPLARMAADRCWIVDPLDGTREFGIAGARDWAVHVALVVDHWPAVGAVELPAYGLGFSTADPPAEPRARSAAGPTIVVSRSRPPSFASPVAEALGGTLTQLGSAGAKAMAVVQGQVDVYLHDGGQYEWDSAAPVAVAAAAALHVSRLDGSPLIYNQAHPYLPDLLICRPELAGAVLAAVRAAR